MIPDSIVDEVRARADIVEVIGEQVQLKRAGHDFKALCPFHNEKTPSFYVVPAKGFYKCFGCGESGDVFSFLMKRSGLSFMDAVRHVAARVGVDIPESRADGPAEDPYRALREAIAFAADFFEQSLWKDEGGERARGYLEMRGIPREAAERFRLGYAPDAWRALREAAAVHGIGDDTLIEAGLLKESERSEEPYDRFRDRLIFPIADVGGRLVAFGGRILGRSADGAPKYLNSPETPLHHKGAILYGLHAARNAIRREGSALVVEGYMDYVSLAARGIEHVVAGMGTAMTVEQANLMARYTKRVYLLYDSDPAGLRATFRTADALLRAGVHPLVVSLPDGEDPDSLVRKRGVLALKPFLDDATDVLERKVALLAERGFFEDIEGKRRALDRLLPTLRSALDPALRDIYVKRVAERTDVRPETLEHELAAVPAGFEPNFPLGSSTGARRRDRRRDGPPPHFWPAPAREPLLRRDAGERLLLLLMLRDPERISQAAAALRTEELRDPVNRELFTALTADRETGGAVSADQDLSAEAVRRREELLADPTELADGDQSFAGAVADIRAHGLFLLLDELDDRMRHAAEGETLALLREQEAVQARLRALEDLGFRTMSRRYRKRARERRPGPSAPPTPEA